MQKLINVFIIMIVSLSGVFLSVNDVKASNDVYIIDSPEDMKKISEDPYGSYEITCDIDMSDMEWEPFAFYGNLKGNGFSIINLNITSVGEEVKVTYDGNYKEYDTVFAGLFSCTVNAVITELNLVNVHANIDTTSSCFVGGIAGYSENSEFTDCSVMGRLDMSVNAPMFGIGGVVGFGNGKMLNVKSDVVMVCIDTNASERDEQFMGGLCAAGYMNMDGCQVNIDGYVSDHGYVHNGGLMGMYFFYPKGYKYYGSITDNRVEGKITFFEDNTNRRAYCKPIVGEYLTYEFEYTGNWEQFTSDERFEYNVNLKPEMCENPQYDVVSSDAYPGIPGYNTYTCKSCGYTYTDDYRLYVDPLAEEKETESVTETNTEETTQEITQEPITSQSEEDKGNPVNKIIIIVVAVIIGISAVLAVILLLCNRK